MQKSEEKIFVEIFHQLMLNGRKISPRGEEVVEIENFHYDFPPYSRFMNFKSRKLNLSYIKKEFLWYLKGDRFDTSIAEHATLWKSLINMDGSINSNYGQYIFHNDCNQFLNAAKTLINDKDSRRASMMILQPWHLLSYTRDFPCTYGINFRIRDSYLNMSVHMRSQDAVYGLGNDLPTFSFIHEMMYIYLQNIYPELQYGIYHHTVDSFHIYKKHYHVAEAVLLGDEFTLIFCPQMNYKDVDFMLSNPTVTNLFIDTLFRNWLLI